MYHSVGSYDCQSLGVLGILTRERGGNYLGGLGQSGRLESWD